MLDRCFELVQPALLYQTRCDRFYGPEAASCETAGLFSQMSGSWPPTAEAYEASPQKWEKQMMALNGLRNNREPVYKVYGKLPIGQRLRITDIRRYASNSYEEGTFWAETAILKNGPFAGHSIRIPSGSDIPQHAWVTITGPALPVSTILKQCE